MSPAAVPRRRAGRMQLALLGITCATGVSGPACDSGPGAVSGSIVRAPLIVTRGGLEDRVVLAGEIESTAAEPLRVPRTPAGILTVSWLAEDGITVKKGDKVVEFDASSLAESLDEKRSATVRADNELQRETALAAADLADKQMQVERASAELEKKHIEASVPADLEAARTYQEKQLALSAQRDALAKAREELEAKKRTAALDRTVKEVERLRAVRELAELEKRLDDLVLRAARDGLVQMAINPIVGRKYLSGDQAFPGWIVASLPDLGSLQVHARLSDVDDGSVKSGMAVECTADAYPRQHFRGTLQKVSPMARSDGRDTTRRFFDVAVEFSGTAPSYLRPGMSVRVEVIRRRAEGVLLVPRAALRSWPEKSEVRLASGALQGVTVDFCSELSCAVREGLAEGTRLADPLTPGPAEKGSR